MTIPNRRNPIRPYLVLTATVLIALTAGLIWLTFRLLRPTPPRSVIMAIDPEGSFNAKAAKRYRELLARDGIDLKLAPSAGAVESVARLQDPKSGVSIAIIPSGITDEQKSPGLVSLGPVFYEPLWGFSHGQVLRGYQNLSRRLGSSTKNLPRSYRSPRKRALPSYRVGRSTWPFCWKRGKLRLFTSFSQPRA